jgi:hypothetical protein
MAALFDQLEVFDAVRALDEVEHVGSRGIGDAFAFDDVRIESTAKPRRSPGNRLARLRLWIAGLRTRVDLWSSVLQLNYDPPSPPVAALD